MPEHSKNKLERFVGLIAPTLGEYGFTFQNDENAISSGGEFANGFFVSDKYKIGVVFRGNRLGAIIYETDYSNIHHDGLFEGLDRSGENRLKYDSANFKAFTVDGTELHQAFINDFEDVIHPYLSNTPIEDINKLIKKQRKKMGL